MRVDQNQITESLQKKKSKTVKKKCAYARKNYSAYLFLARTVKSLRFICHRNSKGVSVFVVVVVCFLLQDSNILFI